MGPTVLFDKSFIQSLSIDESVWFDHFFQSVLCAIFYIETLADLEKSQETRTPEEEVALIADKSPEMHCSPVPYHLELCCGNLMGSKVPMTGQIPLRGGRLVKSDMGIGFVYQPTPEADAFLRWHGKEFSELERLYAHEWRQALGSLSLADLAMELSGAGVDGKSCKSLSEARTLAMRVVHPFSHPVQCMKRALLFLRIPTALYGPILQRWTAVGCPPLAPYAPYASYMLTVELFFRIALAANLISNRRLSNAIDIAYLAYLPLCNIFVSSDKLHRRCTPLFLRDDQEFVWGPDLKADLATLDALYRRLPDDIKSKGIISFAGIPPRDRESLVAKLWDRHRPRWREVEEETERGDPVEEAELIAKLESVANSPSLQAGEGIINPGGPEFILVQNPVRKRKGSWWQLPEDLDVEDQQ